MPGAGGGLLETERLADAIMGEQRMEYRETYIGKGKYVSEEELCAFLSEMIRTESTFGNEGNCGRLLERFCREQGLTVELQPVTDTRFNLLITVGAPGYKDAKHGLLLHGHYDTVPALDMEDPYSARVTDGRMWGRGTVDQKSGLVAAVCAALAVKRSGRALKKPVCVAAVVDEESEHRGSYTLVRSGIDADYAVVTEPSGVGKCNLGCKGTTPIRIAVQGLTAHASNPWVGVNAIEKAMPVLEGLFRMKFDEVQLGGDLGTVRGTLCVSKLDAGSAYNNVPGEAVIWMDRRTVPGENTALALDQVNAVIEEARRRDPALKAEAHVARPDWHWPPIAQRGLNPTAVSPDCDLLKILNQAVAAAGLPKIRPEYSNGYNEMDFLINDLGIETLVYGSGNGDLSHGPYEEVEIREVCAVAEVFCHMIEELCM